MRVLAQILEGSPDAQTLEELRRAFSTWLASATQGKRDCNGKLHRARPIALEQCLRLPTSPERARIALRNYYLQQAATHLQRPDLGPWELAHVLHQEAQNFCGTKWPCWLNREQVPDDASPVNRLLFAAMRAGGGKLPCSTRMFYNIVVQS